METDTLIVHSECMVRKALIYLLLCTFCMLLFLSCYFWLSPWILWHGYQTGQDVLSLQGQRPDRPLRTRSSSPAQQWALRPPQPLPPHLSFFPHKGKYSGKGFISGYETHISQYVYVMECKWFQKTGWQNSTSSCCNVTYNYNEILDAITTTFIFCTVEIQRCYCCWCFTYKNSEFQSNVALQEDLVSNY